MKDDYKIQGPTAKLSVEVEKELVELLGKMSGHTKHSVAELANTALKAFVSRHRDFLPGWRGPITRKSTL